MQVKQASANDASVIASFNVLLAWESEQLRLKPAVVRKGVKAIFQDSSRGRYFAAYVGRQLVGMLLVTYEWSDWRNGNFWWLQSVYVDQDFRGQGVFKSLISHVMKRAEQAGRVCGFRLYVEDHNTSAQEVYRRLGFVRTNYQILERPLKVAGKKKGRKL